VADRVADVPAEEADRDTQTTEAAVLLERLRYQEERGAGYHRAAGQPVPPDGLQRVVAPYCTSPERCADGHRRKRRPGYRHELPVDADERRHYRQEDQRHESDRPDDTSPVGRRPIRRSRLQESTKHYCTLITILH